jgi:hypothetical protein
MIQDILWVGSKWWSFDFHTHSPESNDFGKGVNQAELLNMSPKDWLLGFMKANIDCIAITDHNSGTWIDKAKLAYSELADEHPRDFKPLYIFPGVEISVNGNIHVLAILPIEATTSDIDSLLGAVKYRGSKGTCDTCTDVSIIETIEEIVKAGGIAIPAHCDDKNGLFDTCFGNTLNQVIDNKNVFAIELCEKDFKFPQIYIDKKINWSCVLGSDCHHPNGEDGLKYPGSHYTWVKMSEPNFEGLKLALLDGAVSIKRSDEEKDNPNKHGTSEIEKIIIKDAKYIGRSTDFIIEFNPWLNCIIGGRGTGKSTILEFVRLALKRVDEIPAGMSPDFEKYWQIPKDRNDEGLMTDSTKIIVFYIKDDTRFRITWESNNYVFEEEKKDGWFVSEGDVVQRFPVRVYSQKQIFELAKQPQALLHIVDDTPEINYREWNAEFQLLKTKYLSIKAQQRELLASFQEENNIKGALEDVVRKLSIFEKHENADILSNYQKRKNQHNTIDLWERDFNDLLSNFNQALSLLSIPDIDKKFFSLEESDSEELFSEVSKMKGTLVQYIAEIKSIYEKISKLKTEWTEKKSTLQIFNNIEKASLAYSDLLEKLAVVGTYDPSMYAGLVKQRQDFESKLKVFTKKREAFEDLKRESRSCIQDMIRYRALITKARQDFFDKVLKGNKYIAISVVPYGDKTYVEEEIRNLLGCKEGFDKDIGTRNGKTGLIGELYGDENLEIEKRIENFKNKIIAIYTNKAEISDINDKRFVTRIQGLSREQIDHIICWYPEDSIDISYSINRGKDFKPIAQGSPGQKTAALLAFILSYGNEPLILDQPEDDLDNLLISDLIVTNMREIKKSRQIIVVTHNANIVVNGDAENIDVLNIRSGGTRIIAKGGLQESKIRNEICSIMEGGKDAFDQRYKRIKAGDIE